MSITKKILQLIASFALSCTLFTPSAFSATVPWDPARLAEVQVTSGNRLFYPGPGGGFIDTKTVPAAYQKGGAMRESLIAQQKASVASGTAAKPTPAATPASTSTSSTAAKTTSTAAKATSATPKAVKPLQTGRITSKAGNVFTRELFTHTDGQQYYREVHENGQINYRKASTNKYCSGKGFNNTPPPKPGPIKDGGFKGKIKMLGGKVKGWGGKVATAAGGALRFAGGLFSIAAGGMMIWEANAGEGARTGGDLLKAAAGGAMVGMGVASIVPGVGTLIGAAVGAVAGAATVGWQMFSETDCLTDPVTNKQTCCNTTTGDVKRGIGDYMFCGKDGKKSAMVRQCKVGGRSQKAKCSIDPRTWGGCVKDAFSDDEWDKNCETRWCSGTSAPPNGLADLVVYEPDTSKVCWKWRCGDGLKLEGKKCVPNYCDGHGPNEEEKDLPIYQFAIDEENKCIIWDCIDGYQLIADYCAEIIPETTPTPTEQQTTPQPEPAPLEPDLGPDMYEYAIAKIEAMLAEMDAECGIGNSGTEEDHEMAQSLQGATNIKDAVSKLSQNAKYANRAKSAVGKSAEEIDAEDKKEQLESYAKKLAQSLGKSIQKTGVHGNTTSTPTTTKGKLADTVMGAQAAQYTTK